MRSQGRKAPYLIRRGVQRARQALGIVVTLIAVACTPPPKPAPSVTYYRAHADEREAVLADCLDHKAEKVGTGPCINAREAGRLEGIGSLRNLPPIFQQITPQPSTKSDEGRR